MEYFFLAAAAFATIMFVLLLFSLGKSPGDDVRERMEQYLIESEKASKTGQYEIPAEALENDEEYSLLDW